MMRRHLHHKPKPKPAMHPIELGERMHAHIRAIHRAGEAVRSCHARHRPDLPAEVHKIAISNAPVGAPEVARLLADLMHYAKLTSLSWASLATTAAGLFASEAPPRRET